MGSLPDCVASDCSVNGRPGDTEQVADLGSAVLARLQQRDQVRFLPRVERGLLAPEPALGLGDSYAILGPQANEVGLDSATIASTLNSNRPTGSVGS